MKKTYRKPKTREIKIDVESLLDVISITEDEGQAKRQSFLIDDSDDIDVE